MSSLRKSRFKEFVEWRETHVTDKTFTFVLSFVIGLLASFAAFLLHLLIRIIQNLLTSDFDVRSLNWLFLVFPILGIGLTMMFVKYVVKDNISHGITRVLYAISSKQSFIKPHNTWTSVVASSITIGFGGSVGAEAPIVLTGSAIGSNLGRLFGMDKKTLMVLVGCGASAAIAGIFKAPIAGLVFTLEVLMIDLTMASMLPILISSVTATCFSYIFVGNTNLFTFTMDGLWDLDRLPANILLGVFCGLVSLYFIRSMSAFEGMFSKMKNNVFGKLLLGGIVLSTLIFLFPSLYGEGYSAINILLNGGNENEWNTLMSGSLFYGHSNILLIYVALVILFKTMATASTNGAGGCGGTFAPSLFVGGFSGFLFSHFWNINNIGAITSEKNFTMLGMAGVMAGVMHAPLTGIFLIAELTGGYQMFMPLMIVSVCSVMTISLFERHSIYAMRLAREGKLLTHHTDKSVLTLMNMESVVEHDYTAVAPDLFLGSLVLKVANANTSFIPVVDKGGVLLGEIDITKTRHILFRTELYNRLTVSQIMTPVVATVGKNNPMVDIMEKFDSYSVNYMPVVDVNNVLQGYISRNHVYSLYRKMVADYSAE
jgi:CIC family chloride channel protein